MSEAILTQTKPTRSMGWLLKLARQAVFSRLGRINHGAIRVVEGADRLNFGRASAATPLEATIVIRHPRCYLDVMLYGTVGAGESYGRRDWDCDDLTTLVRVFVLNRELLDGMESGLARVGASFLKAFHRVRRNTKPGSRSNIAAHYDVGNDFFSLMLDRTMMYSCAVFSHDRMSLADASREKNDLICRRLDLSPNDHLLEIGTGWGGFALHAAQHYGCRVTSTTISTAQYREASDRIRAAGLSNRVALKLMDYRDLPTLGMQFDKLVSIEMIEAVGHEYYDQFFAVCSRLLKPDGLMLVQAITIDERLYERAKRSVDFIQRFIFPGSCIPSMSALCNAAAQASDFSIIHVDDIGAHYPPTLRAWRQNLQTNLPHVTRLGYREEFLRLWEFYLCYCEGGFLERTLSTMHMLFAKPAWRDPLSCS